MMPQLSSMIMNSTTFVMIIMFVLALFSIFSWALFFERLFFHKKVSSDIKSLTSVAVKADSMESFAREVKYSEFEEVKFVNRVLENVAVTDLIEKKEVVEKQLENGVNDIVESLYGPLEYLSMVVTISPFLGLLGTVWGIMYAFIKIGQSGEASLAVVAPGIAEALITTIAGLVVAIPASIFYGYYNKKSKSKEAKIVNLYNLIKGLIEYDSKKR